MISEDKFYEELEQVFDNFPKYHIKILVGEFKQKLEKRSFSYRQLGKSLFHLKKSSC